MRKILFFVALFAADALAGPFPSGNPDKGHTLFEQGSCHSCHASMVGGDGNGIFTRPDRKVKSPQQLISQLHSCSTNSGANWGTVEIEHVAAYLNREYYKFK